MGRLDPGDSDGLTPRGAVRTAPAAAEVQQRGHPVRGQGLLELRGIGEFAARVNASATRSSARSGRPAPAITARSQRW